MRILQKKICILGDFAVGKTSLVARFVKNEFSEKYLTTVGVKMDIKQIILTEDVAVKMVIWDIAGDSELTSKTKNYLRGSSGFIFVVDGTRYKTFDSMLRLRREAEELLGKIPFVILLNKHDLTDEWEIPTTELEKMKAQGWQYFFSSAKTGENVELAFFQLAQHLTE